MERLTDKHHLLFPKSNYNHGHRKELRNHWYLIIDIPTETLHATIHKQLNYIPAPRGSTAKDVCSILNGLEKHGAISREDTVTKRLRLLIALFECIEDDTADALKKQLEIVREYINGKAPWL